jgi:hypothetical protein
MSSDRRNRMKVSEVGLSSVRGHPALLARSSWALWFGVAVAANIGVNRAAQDGARCIVRQNIAGADCIVLDEIERNILPPNDRRISTVRIELTDLDGDEVFAANTWERRGSTDCAIATGITLTVPYTLLSATYLDTQRCNVLAGCPTMTPTRTTVDNIAVAIGYTHDWVTPLGSILPLGGGAGWTFEQRNVFRMEPNR